jgi:hypothetical protein
VPDALLELPAVGIRLASLEPLQLGPSGLELLAGARVVDLPRLDGVVHQRERPVLLDLEESRPGRELEHVLGVAVAVDPGRAGLQHRHQGRMPGEHPDLAGVAGHDQHLDLALECRPVGRHEGERKGPPRRHYAGTASASSGSGCGSSASASASPPSPRPFATASSIVPTM